MKKWVLSGFLAFVAVAAAISQTISIKPFIDPVCLGNPITLEATVQGTSYGTDSYTFEVYPYSPEPFTGGTSVIPDFTHCSNTAGGKDDCWAGPYDIGFNFCFFNQIYTQFYVGSNGWIGFTPPVGNAWTTFTATALPNTNPNVPKNCIFCPWEDWLPGLGGVNDVLYYITGTTPNRKLVVYWKNVTFFSCRSLFGTFQIVINETTSVVENHIESKPQCSSEKATQGVHRADGLMAFTATGRNFSQWTAANESTRFVPSGITWHTGSATGPIAGYGTFLTVTPLATTTYFAVVNTCDAGQQTTSATVHVVPTLTGPVTACKASTGHVYITEPGKTNYVWSISAGGSIVAGGTLSSYSATVRWNTPGTQTIGIIYTDPVAGCTSTIPRIVTVTVQDYVSPVITGSPSACINSTGNVYSAQPGKNNYTWTIAGGVITSGGGSSDNTATVTWNTAGIQSINVNFTDPVTSCTPASPSTMTVTVYPTTSPSFTSGPLTACAGVPGLIYATQPGMTGYQWSITGGTITGGGGAADHSATVTWTQPGARTISVNYTDPGNPCTSAMPTVLTVTVTQLPVPSLAGPSPVCLNSAGNVYSTETGMNGYTWAIVPPSAGMITSGAGTNAVSVQWTTVGNQGVLVNYIDPMGCATAAPANKTVTVKMLPDPTLSGPALNCEQTAITYTTETGMQNYIWVISAGGTVTAGGQATDPGVTVIWSTTGSHFISVNYTLAGCVTPNPAVLSFQVKPRTVPAFTACFDIKTTLNAKKITLRGGAPFISGQGVYSGSGVTNPSAGVFEFDPMAAGVGPHNITYSFTNTHGCSASALPVSILVQSSGFTCGNLLTDVRNGKTYPTSQLAGKCWMTGNLDYGTILGPPNTSPQTDNCLAEKYCAPNDANCNSYGGLYQWDEIMDYNGIPGMKGLCPPEWHIPTVQEWQFLIDNLITWITPPNSNAQIGSFLKDPTLSGGFHALTGGVNYLDNYWAWVTGNLTGTIFWTSTAVAPEKAFSRGLNNLNPSISNYSSSRGNAFPVRCIRDF